MGLSRTMRANNFSAFFKSIESQRENLILELGKADIPGRIRGSKKAVRASIGTCAHSVFGIFFPEQTRLEQRGWSETARRKMKAASQFAVTECSEFDVLWALLLEVHRVILTHIFKTFPKKQQNEYHEAWEILWQNGVGECMAALLQKRDKALREKNIESSILSHTLQSLSVEPDLDTLFQKVITHAAGLMHVRHVYLFWTDVSENGARPRLQLKASSRLGKSYGEFSLAFGEGLIGKVAETHEAVILQDYQQEVEKFSFVNDVDQVLIVPMMYSGDVLGVIMVADTRKRRKFTEADKELLTIFINQVAAMLKAVILYRRQAEIANMLEDKNTMLEIQADQILRKKAQLEVMNEVGQQINSSLDLPEVLSLLTRHTADCIGVNRSVVWLMNEKKTGLDAVAAYGVGPEGLRQLSLFLPDIRKTRFFQALFERHAVEIVPGQDAELFQNKLRILADTQALLVVPLLVKQQAIGLLSVDDTREKHDFLEDEVTLISAVVNQAVLAIENARLYQQVKEQAITDVMTGLFNHRYFQLRFTEEFSNCKRYNNALSVIMMDIDHFKHYNDTYGHIAGDLALKEIAQLTKVSVRENDILARYGGEEFVIILPMTPLDGAQVVADRIRSAVADCRFLGDFNLPQVSITVSLGISTYTPAHAKSEVLLREADTALYRAKEGGRNQVVVFQPGMSEV